MSELSARLRRLLFLVPYLARESNGVPIDRLARELDVDREELLSDIDLLTQVGPPSGDPGEYLLVSVEAGKVYVDLAQRLTRPLRLTPREGCALLLGLRALKRSGIAPYDQALASAERKILAALGTDASAAEEMAGETVLASEGEAVAGHLRILHAALRARHAVLMDYAAASSGRAEKRGLEPYGLVHHAGSWYVVGKCQKRGDTRTFRVDRIASLRPTETSFVMPSDFDLEAYRRERLYVPSADSMTVCIRFDARAVGRIGSGWPHGEVTRHPDGSADLVMECEGLEWVLGWVLGFGRHAKILAPSEARTALLDKLATWPT